jgi:hypothetical protein
MVAQFTPSTRHRLFIESQQLGQPSITTMAALQTFQPGKESSLLFIQQAVKQHDGSPNVLLFLVLHLGQGMASRQLFLAPVPRWGGVEIQTRVLRPMNPPGLRQLAKGLLDRHMQTGFQFAGVATGRRCADQGLGGVQQSAVLGKPGAPAHPEPLFVELGDGRQGVKATPMRVAGEVLKGGQLSENRHVDLGSQSFLHLRHRYGSEALEKV